MFDLEKIIDYETSDLIHYILNNNIKYIESYGLHNSLNRNLYKPLGEILFSINTALSNNIINEKF